MLVEPGVYLYDEGSNGTVWVYLPSEFDEASKTWTVDVMTVFPDGRLTVRRQKHSNRYLSSMSDGF